MTYQFYPTGPRLAARMWGLFRQPIRHVVDPSAGKGDLFKHARMGFPGVDAKDIPWIAARSLSSNRLLAKGGGGLDIVTLMRSRFEKVPEASAVEIDTRHHGDLRQLGLKILGYDFMEVSALPTVSQFIMNPPFQDGDAHVLHAWDIAYDAEIAAVVNATVFRNPHTVSRKRLVELVKRFGSVEFLQDQFVDEVERKTDVEVALIYLRKVSAHALCVDGLIEGLREDAGIGGKTSPHVEAPTALALPDNFIGTTYERYKLAVEAAKRSSEAQALAAHLREGLGIPLSQMQANGVGADIRVKPENVAAAAYAIFKPQYDDIKERAWGQIIRSAVLTDKVSNAARKSLEASMKEIYDLEFSVSNVHGLLHGLAESMGDIYTQMVLDLFDRMIEYSSDNVAFFRSYKSNAKHRVGMKIRTTRIILTGVAWSGRTGLGYESRQSLADVDKVFGYLEGLVSGYGGIVATLEDPALREDIGSAGRVSSRFFDLRFYAGTRTLHVYPRDISTVDRLNRFVGRHRQWLPQAEVDPGCGFARQYDQADKLSKGYLERYAKKQGVQDVKTLARRLTWAMSQSGEFKSSESDTLIALSHAIEDELITRKIDCEMQLAGESCGTLLPSVSH